jgi:hypothetical protein
MVSKQLDSFAQIHKKYLLSYGSNNPKTSTNNQLLNHRDTGYACTIMMMIS